MGNQTRTAHTGSMLYKFRTLSVKCTTRSVAENLCPSLEPATSHVLGEWGYRGRDLWPKYSLQGSCYVWVHLESHWLVCPNRRLKTQTFTKKASVDKKNSQNNLNHSLALRWYLPLLAAWMRCQHFLFTDRGRWNWLKMWFATSELPKYSGKIPTGSAACTCRQAEKRWYPAVMMIPLLFTTVSPERKYLVSGGGGEMNESQSWCHSKYWTPSMKWCFSAIWKKSYCSFFSGQKELWTVRNMVLTSFTSHTPPTQPSTAQQRLTVSFLGRVHAPHCDFYQDSLRAARELLWLIHCFLGRAACSERPAEVTLLSSLTSASSSLGNLGWVLKRRLTLFVFQTQSDICHFTTTSTSAIFLVIQKSKCGNKWRDCFECETRNRWRRIKAAFAAHFWRLPFWEQTTGVFPESSRWTCPQ